jgi:AcrR family transcriptional regulator
MLETAMRLMQSGVTPSVSDVAEAAEVSRATAYRYFPTQAAMIQAAVDEALGPILDWSSDTEDAQSRVAALLDFAYPRMEQYEATHRAALLLALDQWSRRQAGTLGV